MAGRELRRPGRPFDVDSAPARSADEPRAGGNAMKFTKLHGTGNDFVLIDARDRRPRDWSALARVACDRHFGVGSDGILLVQDSKSADYRMVMYNPDGSEAEMCGNGIRCFARYLFDANETRGPVLSVETG